MKKQYLAETFNGENAYSNEELNLIAKSATTIEKNMQIGKKSALAITDELHNIFTYTKGNDFALIAQEIGYSRNTAYKYAKVGEYRKVLSEMGIENVDDFGVGQLIEMLVLAPETIVDLIANGTITTDLRTKDIRDIIKSLSFDCAGNVIEDSESYEAEESEAEEAEEAEETKESIIEKAKQRMNEWLDACPIKMTKKEREHIEKLLNKEIKA